MRGLKIVSVLAVGTSMLCGSLSAVDAASARNRYDADIQWTEYGIPHITARDLGSLGFGTGYAYASLNACLLLDTVMTVRGERSRYYGPDADAMPGFQKASNLASDVFFRSYFDPDALENDYRTHHADAWQLITGYAAGVNYFLARKDAAAHMHSCAGKPWVQSISPRDIVMVIAQKAVLASGSAFTGALLNAAPPGQLRMDNGPVPEPASSHTGSVGSNAYAFGAAVTKNKSGILVGNPHFPWEGPNRFFEMHQIIPGKLDVMGAALGGFPLVNIGFNHDVAWSHTLSTGQRFTLFRLALEPGHPDRYLIDGKPEPMSMRLIDVPVLEKDGTLGTIHHTVYMTRFGPVVVAQKRGLTWDGKTAFAFADSERGNTRMIDQWLRIAQSHSSGDLLNGLKAVRGLPWVNTIAADRHGKILLADESIVPDVNVTQNNPCIVKMLSDTGPVILDGTTTRCDWAGRPPLSSSVMPAVLNDTTVFNSNDAPWVVNSNDRLKPIPGIVGSSEGPLRLRSRMSIAAIQQRLAETHNAVTPETAASMVLDDQNYAAREVMSAMEQLCGDPEFAAHPLSTACKVLLAWDRRDQPDSKGAVLFREFWQRVPKTPQLWSVSFNPDAPGTTPNTLALSVPAVREHLKTALLEAIDTLGKFHFPLDAPLSAVQYRSTLKGEIPVPGGREFEGTLNIAGFGSLTDHGYRNHSIVGTSYLQVVTWDAGKLRASGILAYGQSSEPDAPYYSDQTRLFSSGKLIDLSFERSLRSSNTTPKQEHISLFRSASSLIPSSSHPE